MKCALCSILLIFLSFIPLSAQIPTAIHIQILKAEDARHYDKTLEALFKNGSEKVRVRAALAAGRIGDERAIPALTELLEKDTSAGIRAMAAFALGEIESIKGADAILNALKAETRAVASVPVTARAVEAAGKIAAVNAKDEKSKVLAEAILDTLESENNRGPKQSREVVLLALTAALRAAPKDTKRERPDKTDFVVAKFLTSVDARVRADAANTLSRVRAKNANEALRKMLSADADPIARANAARALGAAEGKSALDDLLDAATRDGDERVRVSAIRSLATLNDAKASARLLDNGESYLQGYRLRAKPSHPLENRSELLEIASALGRIHQGKPTDRVVKFLRGLRETDRYRSPETEIAMARVTTVEYPVATPDFKRILAARGPARFLERANVLRSFIAGYGEAANVTENESNKSWRDNSRATLEKLLANPTFFDVKVEPKLAAFVLPDVLRAYAGFKPTNLPQVLRASLLHADVFVRSTAADLLADQPASKESLDALKSAFSKSVVTDSQYNDAQMSILDAIYKLNKSEGVGVFLLALDNPDYLVRKKAFQLLADEELRKGFPGIEMSVSEARKKGKQNVLVGPKYLPTGQGQILNTDVDYRRALSRKKGSVKAILTTEKGAFTIEFFPEDAPLTVDNFIKLARARYFNGLEVHRVVPNFVMQDGDPRGDGNGGPGWSIRCEMNMRPYERGAVGMALAGKDTGGSQWFVTHSPQPHLDGGYTVFGRVSETDMLVVDKIARGDRILNVRIVGR